METQILDGKNLAKKIKDQLKTEVIDFKNFYSRLPKLSVILVGTYQPSQIYVQNKIKSAQQIGMDGSIFQLSERVNEADLIAKIKELNLDPTIDAILVQLPLPSHLNFQIILDHLDPYKDADGLTYLNLGKLVAQKPYIYPCTPAGIMELFKEYQVSLSGKHVVVVGRSLIVGRTLALMLTEANATVTVAHSKTTNLAQLCRQADICVFAAHQKNYFNRDFVKSGAIVIDVGIHQLDDKKITGDVDFNSMLGWASMITPVPGGVGPLTVAMLLKNTLALAKARLNVKN